MGATDHHSITQLLTRWTNRQPRALDRVVEKAYAELLRIGRRQLRGERYGHTLQTAGLVHEAYLRLGELNAINWRDRRHFFAVAAGIMRRVLVDRARVDGAFKRGGDAQRVPLNENLPVMQREVDVVGLDSALGRLGARDPVQARVVELRYFGGLTVEQTAEILAIAPVTVKRKWSLAKAWLYRELHEA